MLRKTAATADLPAPRLRTKIQWGGSIGKPAAARKGECEEVLAANHSLGVR
jgi:hypothetical protein